MTFVAPPVSDRRLAVRVTRDAERRIRAGHPWVFDGSVESVSHDGRPGDLAVIFDHKRDFLAIGLWDPGSPIRIRVLHQGRPRAIDDDFWASAVVDAVGIREPLSSDPSTTGLRVVNGENDGFGGLVVDVYDTVGVMKVYSAAWLPHLPPILAALVELVGLDTVIARHSRLLSGADRHGLEDGAPLVGVVPEDGVVPFLEHDLTFHADVVHGQKTGHFLDQRDNRAMVGALAADARVLDVFCHSGGFSVHASAGGARSVTSVDQSPHALRQVAAHLAANAGVTGSTRSETVQGDAFEVLAAMERSGERFDIVVIDPPSFAGRQVAVARALRSYRQLTRSGLAVLTDGGTLVQASCSARVAADDFVAVVNGAAAEVGVALDDQVITGHALDHPVTFPEGAYLKAVFATANRL
ncbi:MAG: class I SAM-dependent rRNA methyltransferase [Actinomycetota bacterium]